MISNEAIVRNSRLVHFDLDGTLIDDAYQLTDMGINHAVEATQSRGWDIGLSSDSPYESLAKWRERLSMSGPIVAEKGAVVEVGDRLIFDRNIAAQVALARKAISVYLGRSCHTTVWQGDSTEIIRQNRTVGEPGQRSVLLNNLSRCSLRFYVRRVTNDGHMVIDDDLTQETIDELRPLYPEISQPSIDNNPSFGLMIIGDGTVNKRTGLLTLLDERSYKRRIMVGNSMGDYIGSDLVEQYAVSNADKDYMQRSQVLDRPLTSGCIDILESLN